MSEELTDRELRELSDALARQAPFVQELGKALLRNGDFTEGIGEKTAEHLFGILREELHGCCLRQTQETAEAIEHHVENCVTSAEFSKHTQHHTDHECYWGLIALARKHIVKILLALVMTTAGGYSLNEIIGPSPKPILKPTKEEDKMRLLAEQVKILLQEVEKMQNTRQP